MSIQQAIAAIKAKRSSEFLPKIEQRIKFLDKLEKQLESLTSLMTLIRMQNESKQGAYYAMLLNDPEMEIRLQKVSIEPVSKLLVENRKELERLKKRFSRASISLQVFGMAGSGKSTFIQSVTGLSNDVVLAAEGGHCTGVASFIYNSDHFEARVYLYTQVELLNLFNKNLQKLQEGYKPNQPPLLLQNFGAIKTFKLSDVGLPDTLEGRMAVTKYVQHFDRIQNLILGKDEHGDPLKGIVQDLTGRYYVQITDPKEVQKWVAQHNGHHTGDENYVAYYNYLAVDHVDIYQQFNYGDAGDIVLMDNVGLGDDASDISTEAHMYQAIADNSDAVILLYQPKPNSAWRGEEGSMNSRLNKIRYTDLYRGKERMDVNELYFLLNERATGGFDNSKDCPEVVKKFREEPYERKETILIANASDKVSVRDRAIIPILTQLTSNLETIDSRKIQCANELGEQLYAAYQELCRSVAKVVSGSVRQGSNEFKKIRQLYETDLDYSNELKKLDDLYAAGKEKECPEVQKSIDGIINRLTSLVNDPEIILKDVERGIEASNGIFEKHVKAFRNGIYMEFSDLNINTLIPLQEKVKEQLISVLFTNAKFGRIPLLSYAIEEGPSIAWLEAFLQEKIDREDYPSLYNMLRLILDYKLNIQGLIEYRVAQSLSIIDKHHADFRTMQPITGVKDLQHAQKIWGEIINRATIIQTKMRVWRDEFALIPSHSFYARVSMFRDMMVDDDQVENDLYSFYTQNRMTIWREEYVEMLKEEEAFGNWNEESAAITSLCIKNEFITKL